MFVLGGVLGPSPSGSITAELTGSVETGSVETGSVVNRSVETESVEFAEEDIVNYLPHGYVKHTLTRNLLIDLSLTPTTIQ